MNPMKIIVPAVIIWVVGLLFGHIEKKNEKELINAVKSDCVTVRLPKAYLAVGIIGIGFSAGVLLLYTVAPYLFTPGSSWLFYAVMAAYGVVCLHHSFSGALENKD